MKRCPPALLQQPAAARGRGASPFIPLDCRTPRRMGMEVSRLTQRGCRRCSTSREGWTTLCSVIVSVVTMCCRCDGQELYAVDEARVKLSSRSKVKRQTPNVLIFIAPNPMSKLRYGPAGSHFSGTMPSWPQSRQRARAQRHCMDGWMNKRLVKFGTAASAAAAPPPAAAAATPLSGPNDINCGVVQVP